MTGAFRRGGAALHLLAPPIVWALHFSLLYASESVFCTWADMATPMPLVVIVSLAAVALQVPLMAGAVRNYHEANTTDFVRLSGFALALLAICGIVWTTVSAVIVPSCAGF